VPARLAAPWYVHPAENPPAWAVLKSSESPLAFAVINVANGPGPAQDPYYPDALRGGTATTRLLGYVPVGFGARPVTEIITDIRAWRDRYGITGIMLDETPSRPRNGHWDVSILPLLRASGADVIVANPGTIPCDELLNAADLTCTFEGSWADYQVRQPGSAARRISPQREWHLVHSCPSESVQDALRHADEHDAGFVWATPGVLPDPWSVLPETWPSPR
jgi:spherulation-specific family 4 protein